MDRSRLVDAEPVPRHFGANKKKAIEVYAQFVNAALAQKSQQEYLATEGRMLGTDEFLDEVKHRIGVTSANEKDEFASSTSKPY